ncbi:sulfite exporter TauE/SafE family protein [Thalassobaculum sp.]|uniref:sulfite exporter TauE/SafE family protein n=1 Tax=Thalassobaculum sp. TaxID=2022740 RepID=UPI0032EC85A9
MPAELVIYLVAAGGALLGATASGLAGFAFAATTLGLYAHFLPHAAISPLIVAASLAVQLILMPMIWRRLDWGAALPFLAGGVCGVPFGAALLSVLSADTFRHLAGALLVIYAGSVLVTGRLPSLRVESRLADAAVGFGGGVLGGFAGLSGVLPTIWCSLRRWPKDRQRSVFQLFNTAMHVVTLSTYAVQGRLTAEVGGLFLAALPGIGLGAWLGFSLYRRIDDKAFARVLLILLGVSGIGLLVPLLPEILG